MKDNFSKIRGSLVGLMGRRAIKELVAEGG
ncbi:MAG: hypothetical protein CM15mP82_4310 [Methanobacteriota archaeon]|nr:MAG: hypothetical protein CM15mP82_4310 [Euryarchaeota archaeon]